MAEVTRKLGLSTTAIHGGAAPPTPGSGVTSPLVQSVNYVQETGTSEGLRYTRYGNTPNAEVIQRRLAQLEGSEAALVLSSGMGAVILGLGRGLGETMAVTMVIGNNPAIAKSLLAPGYTMASVIANEFNEATSDLHRSALIEIGLALFIVTIIVNILAGLMVWTVTRGTPARTNA